MKTGLWNTEFQQCWINYLFTGWKKLNLMTNTKCGLISQRKKETNKPQVLSTKGDQPILSRQWVTFIVIDNDTGLSD